MNFELPDDVQGLVAIAREFREQRLDPLEAEFLRDGNVPWPLRPKLQDEARSAGSGRSTSPRSTAGSAWASSRSARSTRSSTGTR